MNIKQEIDWKSFDDWKSAARDVSPSYFDSMFMSNMIKRVCLTNHRPYQKYGFTVLDVATNIAKFYEAKTDAAGDESKRISDCIKIAVAKYKATENVLIDSLLLLNNCWHYRFVFSPKNATMPKDLIISVGGQMIDLSVGNPFGSVIHSMERNQLN